MEKYLAERPNYVKKFLIGIFIFIFSEGCSGRVGSGGGGAVGTAAAGLLSAVLLRLGSGASDNRARRSRYFRGSSAGSDYRALPDRGSARPGSGRRDRRARSPSAIFFYVRRSGSDDRRHQEPVGIEGRRRGAGLLLVHRVGRLEKNGGVHRRSGQRFQRGGAQGGRGGCPSAGPGAAQSPRPGARPGAGSGTSRPADSPRAAGVFFARTHSDVRSRAVRDYTARSARPDLARVPLDAARLVRVLKKFHRAVKKLNSFKMHIFKTKRHKEDVMKYSADNHRYKDA